MNIYYIAGLIIAFILIALFSLYKGKATIYPYKLNDKFFSQSELFFYKSLKDSLNNKDVFIFSKVRIADIVTVLDLNKNYGYWNKIKSKHIDFLLCSYDSSPLLCIELDGKSHLQHKAKINDSFKNEVFDTIGLNIFRYKVSQNYDFSEIIELVNVKMTL